MVSTFHHDNLNLKMFNSFHINLIAKKKVKSWKKFSESNKTKRKKWKTE